MTPDEISQLRVVDLRAELTKRGLDSKGLKAALVARLTEAVSSDSTGGAPKPSETEEEMSKPEPPQESNISQAAAVGNGTGETERAPDSAPSDNAKPMEVEATSATQPAQPSDTSAQSNTANAPPSNTEPVPAHSEARGSSSGAPAPGAPTRSRSRDRDARQDRPRRSRSPRERSDRHRHRSRSPRDRYRRSHSRGRQHRGRSPSYSSRSDSPPRKKVRNWDIGPTGEITAPMRPPPNAGRPGSLGYQGPGNTGGAGGPGGSGGHHPGPHAPHPSRAGQVAMGQDPSHSSHRPARRLYVGGVPQGITEQQIIEFFNAAMTAANLAGPDAVVSAQLHRERNFAFIEFKGPEEATKAMVFDGIQFSDQNLRIRRPKDYIPPPGERPAQPAYVPGVISHQVHDGPNKIYMGGLPNALGAEQIKELLQAFGPLRAFHLVTDSATGQSKGYCFCEFVDHANTQIAIQGLNGMEIMGRTIQVSIANSKGSRSSGAGGSGAGSGANRAPLGTGPGSSYMPGVQPGIVPQQGPPPGFGGPPMGGAPMGTTPILRLSNMITPQDLQDDAEYNDILADIREECSSYGRVLGVVIPRDGPGMLKVYVEFDNGASAEGAFKALQFRKFGGQTVSCDYYDPGRFRNRDYA